MFKNTFKEIIVTMLVLLISPAIYAQKAKSPPPFTPALDEKIQNEIKNFSGKVWIYAKNLDTGKDTRCAPTSRFARRARSNCRLWRKVFARSRQGKLNWTDEIVLTKQVKQGGSGVLSEFADNTKIDLKTAVNLMIVVSDNTATNLVLDKVTADSVNDFMDALGLKQTRSMRKIGGRRRLESL
jgi:beta-lactamase class A